MTTKTISVKVDSGNSEATVKKLDSAMKQLASGTKLTADEIAVLNSAAKSLKTNLTPAAQGVSIANKNLGNFGRNAGQVGIQVQQLVGQIQGGQNAFQAFGAQAADIGIVLGAPLIGVTAAFAAAIAGTLAPALFSAKNEIEQLEIATRKLDNLLENQTGVNTFTEDLKRLASQSKALARVEVAKGFKDAQEQVKIATDGILSDVSKFLGSSKGFESGLNDLAEAAGKSFSEFRESVDNLDIPVTSIAGLASNAGAAAVRIDNLSRKLGISKQEAIDLSLAFEQVQSEKSVLSIKRLENSIVDINDKIGLTSPKFAEFAQRFITLSRGAIDGNEKINLLRQAFNDLGSTVSQQDEKLENNNKKTQEAIDINNAYRVAIGQMINERQRQLAQELLIEQSVQKNIEAEQIKTQQLQAEIAIRRQLAAGEIDQQTANQEIALQNLLFGYEARRNAILEDDRLTKEQQAAQLAVLNDQEVAAQELLEQRLTQTKAKGVEDRKRLEMTQNKQIAYYGQAALAIGSILGKKSEKQRKKWGIAQTVINTAVGIQKAVADYGYPAALPAIAAVAASGIAQIAAINSAGSGSGSISSSTPAAPTPAAQPAQQQQQSSTVEFLGLDGLADSLENSDRLYTGDQMALLVRSLNEAARNGLNTNIGG